MISSLSPVLSSTVGGDEAAAHRIRAYADQSVRGWRLAEVAAVQRQATLKFIDFGSQLFNLLRQRLRLREQRSVQIVFVSNTESAKIWQSIHTICYRLSLPFLKPGIAMLLQPI